MLYSAAKQYTNAFFKPISIVNQNKEYYYRYTYPIAE